MKQLNVRLPLRLAEEFDISCQLAGKTKRTCAVALILSFVTHTREDAHLPAIPREELLSDTPKPTEPPL